SLSFYSLPTLRSSDLAVISAWWIRQTTLEDRLTMMEFMAEEIANQTVRGHSDDEQSLSDVDVREFLTNPGKYMDIDSTPVIFIKIGRAHVLTPVTFRS